MKCYYAHPVSLYGTAERPNKQEQRDIATLTALGFTVVNPNSPEHDAGYKDLGMAYFTGPSGIVSTCAALAFRGFPGHRIPAGVVAEICCANDCGMPVIELPSFHNARGLTPRETRDMLKELGVR